MWFRKRERENDPAPAGPVELTPVAAGPSLSREHRKHHAVSTNIYNTPNMLQFPKRRSSKGRRQGRGRTSSLRGKS